MIGKKHGLRSDLKKVDAHNIGAGEYRDIPEVTEEEFARAIVHESGRPLRRGRPRSARPKKLVSLRLDIEVVERLRASGPGWQTRVNETLRKKMGL